MAVNLSPLAGAGWQFFGNDGLPLNGGKLYTYTAGTTTPLATYTDNTGGTPCANPIILDSTGRTTTEVWLTSGSSYKFVVKTSADVTLSTNDNIIGVNDLSVGSGLTTALASPPPIGTTTPNVVWATYINVTGSTVPAVGFYRSTTNTLAWSTNTTVRGTVNSTGNTTFNAPSSGVGVTVRGVSGTHSFKLDDSAGTTYNGGFLEIPQNSQTVNYQLVLADSGKHVLMNGTTLTLTVPANATVAFPTGTVITVINSNASALSIAITTDTMTKAGTTTTGTRSLAQNGVATLVKIGSTSWIVNGTGLT